MEYLDLHAHMVSRTTDDYTQMAQTGCKKPNRVPNVSRVIR